MAMLRLIVSHAKNGLTKVSPNVTPLMSSLIMKRNASKDTEEIRLPHPTEHATGEEKLLRLAEEMGIDDPYHMKPIIRGPGTKDNPNLVYSFEDKRFVGCICEEDATHINYMWVHMGENKRCECGYWFKLVPARKFWLDVGYTPPYLDDDNH